MEAGMRAQTTRLQQVEGEPRQPQVCRLRVLSCVNWSFHWGRGTKILPFFLNLCKGHHSKQPGEDQKTTYHQELSEPTKSNCVIYGQEFNSTRLSYWLYRRSNPQLCAIMFILWIINNWLYGFHLYITNWEYYWHLFSSQCYWSLLQALSSTSLSCTSLLCNGFPNTHKCNITQCIHLQRSGHKVNTSEVLSFSTNK